MSFALIVAMLWLLIIVAVAILTWRGCVKAECGIDDANGYTAVFTVAMIGIGILVVATAFERQREQFCTKYMISDDYSAHYVNNTDLPVMVRVATYGAFSGERETDVVVPPKQTKYFGLGKILSIESE